MSYDMGDAMMEAKMTKTDSEEEDTLVGAIAFLLLFLLAFIVFAAVFA